MRRSEARELLMQMLYSMEAQGDFSGEAEKRFEDDYLGETDQSGYFRSVWSAAADNLSDIDEMIGTYARGWQLSRIAKTDLAVLRLCLAEIYYSEAGDIPENAAVSEAVRLAKKYGTEDSGKFVNGILGRIVREKGKEEKGEEE